MVRKVLCVGMLALAVVCGWMLTTICGWTVMNFICKEIETVSATVCEVNEEAVAFEDASGEIWIWELEEGESFELGQQVQIQFNDMGTNDIYDDEIIQIIFEKGA